VVKAEYDYGKTLESFSSKL